MTRARSMMPRVGAAPQAKLEMVKMVTQDMRKRLRPNLRENQLLAGRRWGLVTREVVRAQVASSVDARREPAMYGRATEAMAVSSTSMKVASMTDMAISHGL